MNEQNQWFYSVPILIIVLICVYLWEHGPHQRTIDRRRIELFKRIRDRNLIDQMLCFCEQDGTSCFERFAKLITLEELSESLPNFTTHRTTYIITLLLEPHILRCEYPADLDEIERLTDLTLCPNQLTKKGMRKWLELSPDRDTAHRRFERLNKPKWARSIIAGFECSD